MRPCGDLWYIFFKQHFVCVSLLTCSYCWKPVEDDVHFYIYKNIFMFLLPFWKLTCKYFLLISFLKGSFVVFFGFGFGFFCMRSRRRGRGEGTESLVHRGHVTASIDMALFTGIKYVYFHRKFGSDCVCGNF